MMVVGQEVVLDLTDTEEDYKVVLKRARDTALKGDVQEFTLVSHLDVPFLVRDLSDILKHTKELQYLSLFSIALSGTAAHFHAFAEVLKSHKHLKEVHMVDCGMYGNYKLPKDPAESSVSSAGTASITATNTTTPGTGGSSANISGVAMMDTSIRSHHTTRTQASLMDATATTTASIASGAANSKASTKASVYSTGSMISMCAGAPPTMDVILDALAEIKTLENVELYGIPNTNFDLSDDADNESDHRPVLPEGENKDDIPMVPMASDDSTTHSDNDFMDDYDEDIRGIPGCRQKLNKNRKLTLLMSPDSIGALCRTPALTNMGLEDLNLGDDHIESMMKSLSMKGNCLKELKIWGCNITDRGAKAIAAMLQVNNTLERLDLANNHINDAGCIAIAKALHMNTKLQALNLMGNECANNYDAVSEGGCYEALMELMEKNKTLTDLMLEPYEQDDENDVPEFIFIPQTVEDDASSATDASL